MILNTSKKTRRIFSLFLLTFVGYGQMSVSNCHAGGGPENVFLLVNPASQDSMTIANQYIALRKIPESNVLYLPYTGKLDVASGRVFREQILVPAFAAIEERKLKEQIDYLVYSCDYPWRINFGQDFPDEKFPPYFSPFGSLTGMTYLHQFVTEKRKEVVSLNTNWYFTDSAGGVTTSRAFRSQYRWAVGGRRTRAQGLSYMMSSMLGVTFEKGNTVREILHSMNQAKKADGTKPKGTIYFVKHEGPRSKPRHNWYAAAATELRRLGVAAKVLEGQFLKNKTNIMGVTTGIVYVNLATSGCRFLPGAFCDNLTSAGGQFYLPRPLVNRKTGKKRTGQIMIGDFIRHGATAACGTVCEPQAIAQKFPHPSVHVHYASGCSLGESFYQSVSGPYQQLLVGDPLCQPWAEIPVVLVDGITNAGLVSGEVELTPRVEDPKNPIRDFELYVDGIRKQRCKPGEVFQLDTTALADGSHEFRIVARDDTPIETQGRIVVICSVKNGRSAIQIKVVKQKISVVDKQFTVRVVSTLGKPVDVYCNSLKLGTVSTGNGSLQIDIEKVGSGPIKLYATGAGVRSRPVQLKIAG